MTINGSFTLPFRDRTEAGRILATRLDAYADRPDTIVFALPRGGVPVEAEIAEGLHAPLFAFVVRKLGVPGVGHGSHDRWRNENHESGRHIRHEHSRTHYRESCLA